MGKVALAVAGLCILSALRPTNLVGKEPARAFLDGLRNRGYQDVAMDYLDLMQTSALAPPDLKDGILYEKSLVLVDLSRTQRDNELRTKQLDQAQSLLRKFIDEKASNPKANAARSTLGSLIVERARMIHGQAQQDNSDELQAQSRKLYEQAFTVFSELQTQVDAELSKIPVVLDPRDRKQAGLIQQRKQLRADFLQTELLAAAIREELADHLPEGSEDQKKFLVEAASMYDGIYKKYRTRLAGLYARMYQGRCNKRLGKTKDALGYFGELLDQPSEPESMLVLKAKTLRLAMETWLSPGQRKYMEAIRQASTWMDESPKQKEREPDWLAIRYSLARAYKMRADDAKADGSGDKSYIAQTLAVARRELVFVAEVPGEFQQPARDLLEQLGGPTLTDEPVGEPETFQTAAARGKEGLDAMTAGSASVLRLQQSIAAETDPAKKTAFQQELTSTNDKVQQAQADAIKYYRLALELADSTTPQSNVNLAHYFLCYIHYVKQDYFDAALIGEFVAKRYPTSPGAKQCAKIAMACYLKIADQNTDSVSTFEVDRLYSIGNTMAKTWPSDAETEVSLATLVPHLINAGRVDRAAEFVGKIPETSARRGELELVAGQSAWGNYLNVSQELRQWQASGPPEDANIEEKEQERAAHLEQARGLLKAGFDRLPEESTVDRSKATALLSLAQVYVEDGKATDAVSILEHSSLGPLTLVREQSSAATEKVFIEETYRTALRAYVGSLGSSDDAMENAKAVMKQMQDALGSDTAGKQRMLGVYVSLAQDVEKQMKGASPEAKERLSGVFEAFLLELSGGSSDLSVLNWVAETFFSLASGFDDGGEMNANATKYYGQAASAFQNILNQIPSPKMQTQAKLRLATIADRTKDFATGLSLYEEVLRASPSAINVQQAAAKMLQAWGAQDPQRYQQAIAGTTNKTVWGWSKLAIATSQYKQYRDVFLESRYEAANCQIALSKVNPGDKKRLLQSAKKQLTQTLVLYPTMDQSWRDKFESLMQSAQ